MYVVIRYFNDGHPDAVNGELSYSERIDEVFVFDYGDEAERFMDSAPHYPGSSYLMTRAKKEATA